MRRLRLRDLAGTPPDPGRIFYTALWFKRLNNARYDDLVPRLERVDALLISPAETRIARGLAYRGYWSGAAFAAQRLELRRAASRYAGLLCTEYRQIDAYPGPVVVDVDDTDFGKRDVGLLSRPNVRACVVTTARAGSRLAELGVRAPFHVIPQGVELARLDPDAVRAVAAAYREQGWPVVGYVASLLFDPDEPEGKHPLYGVGHLLELWEAIRARMPEARLWLLGRASERLRRRLAGRDDVRLFGWLPRADVLPHVAAFDVALYPRPDDVGLQAVKVVEYLAAGVPTVSYDLEVTDVLRGTGAAAVVRTPAEFVDAVVRLLGDEAERSRLGQAARRAAEPLDWQVLARRYETEILDRYLPSRD